MLDWLLADGSVSRCPWSALVVVTDVVVVVVVVVVWFDCSLPEMAIFDEWLSHVDVTW